MSGRFPRLVLAGTIFLLLAGCAANRGLDKSGTPIDDSHPVFASIYYYTTATYIAAQGDPQMAGALLDKALASDPGSLQIKKSLLLNAHREYAAGSVSQSDLDGMIDLYARLLGTDEDVLYANLDYYEALADTTRMERALNTVQRLHPSARAYLQRFLFSLKYLGITDTGLLDSALPLAQNDPATLQTLARVYHYFDREKEKLALLRYRELAPGEEASSLLAEYIVGNQDVDLAAEYLAPLEYPQDLDAYQILADAAISVPRDSILFTQADRFLATGDLNLLHALAWEALLSDRKDVLTRIREIVSAQPASAADAQPLISLLTVQSIRAGETHALDPEIDRLSEAQYFDNILAYYNYALNAGPSGDWQLSDPDAYAFFSRQVSQRLSDAPPSRYLQAIAAAVRDSTDKHFVDAKYDLVRYLRQRHQLSAEDYEYLLNYYSVHDSLTERRAVLEEAQSVYTDNPLFCNDLGYALLIEGRDPERAVRLIRRAVAVEPDNPYYLDSLAWYHYLRGEYSEAGELLAIPAAMENLPAEIAWHIGAINYRLGDLAQARLFLEKCLSIDGDPTSAAQAAELLKLLP